MTGRGEGASLMLREAREAPDAVRRLLDTDRSALLRLVHRLREAPPPLLIMCGRGSSDHAAVYGRYLLESRLGLPVVHAAPATTTMFGKPHHAMRGALCIVISQSGASPDLLAVAAEARDAGATLLALVNDTASPLAGLADVLLPLHAGREQSVAASKSFIASLAGLALLAAEWTRDVALREALERSPDVLAAAARSDWSEAVHPVAGAASLFTIGRGLTLGIAREAALKLKETSALHAEAFSSAEVRHGPMALVRKGFPVLAFAGDDASGADVVDTVHAFADMGASVFLAGGTQAGARHLPFPAAPHPALSPLLMAQAFYPLAERIAVARGLSPDHPAHLSKVTRTL